MPKYTSIKEYLQPNQRADHNLNERSIAAAHRTVPPMTVNAYIAECARLGIFDGTRWAQMKEEDRWANPKEPKLERLQQKLWRSSGHIMGPTVRSIWRINL